MQKHETLLKRGGGTLSGKAATLKAAKRLGSCSLYLWESHTKLEVKEVLSPRERVRERGHFLYPQCVENFLTTSFNPSPLIPVLNLLHAHRVSLFAHPCITLNLLATRTHSSVRKFALPRRGKRVAFTLAEVLITLGVIGVVAAMTMPVIVANVKEKSLESALKKAQSSLINGYKQMMARESVFRVSNLPIMSCARNASCFSSWHKSAFKVVDDSTSGLSGSTLPQEYLLEDGYESPFSWDDVPYLFRTADGMSYGVEIEDGYETFSVYADINGKKSPNTVCKDMQKFRISGVGNILNVCSEMADTNTCSINNLSACNGQQCQALAERRVNDPLQGGNPGLWNIQGHFIHFSCDGNGVSFTNDLCQEATRIEYQRGIESYCR